jgi:hypothetical protein
MAFKNLGPNVSEQPQAVVPGGGSFTAEQRSLESIIFQSNKPVTDWEMNLLQEILGDYGVRALTQKVYPSGFLDGDFLDDITTSFIYLVPDPPLATTANSFQIRSSNVVVNGWQIDFNFTDSAADGLNVITLPVPDIGVGPARVDFVFLEVWRARLEPQPSTTNKSVSAQILRDGNVRSPDGPPIGNENLADDILDPIFLAETTERVQIQYRYRVFSGMDLITYPDGLDDPLLFANTTPALGPFPDGNPTIYNYLKSATDPGLWIAGTGDAPSAAALGTVDGFIYAIPVCAVYRRNSAAFNRNTNLNGGSLMTTGVPTRPDVKYADQISFGDVQDLRKSVVWDIKEVLQKTTKRIFSNTLFTQGQVSVDGPGGVFFLVRDNIGLGQHMGDPDAVRMTYSDRSITESVVAQVSIGGIATPSITIDLNNLPVWWQGPVNVQGGIPTASFSGLGLVRIVDSVASIDKDGFDLVSPFFTSAIFSTFIGPGVDRLVLTFDAAVTLKEVFVELLITYPTGLGTAKGQLSTEAFWTPPAVNIAPWFDAAVLTPTSDGSRFNLPFGFWIPRPQHREVTVQLPTIPITANFFNTPTNTIFIPELLTGPVTINDGSNPIYATTSYTVGTLYTEVTLTFPIPANTIITATYTALRGIPPVVAPPGDSYQFFYDTNAVQTVPVPAGNQQLKLFSLITDETLYVISFGSGSPDDGLLNLNGGGTMNYFNIPPSNNIPVGVLPSISFPESELDAPTSMIMNGTTVTTGLLGLPLYMPSLQTFTNTKYFSLLKGALDVTVDADGRNFWPLVSNPGILGSVSGQDFQFAQKHKTAFSILAEIEEDFAFVGRNRTLVLAMFTRYTDFDTKNNVQALSSLTDSCVGIYRIPGNLIYSRKR